MAGEIKAVVLDIDGIIIKRGMYFSGRYSREFGVDAKKLAPFFRGEFQLCLVGKADLKEELNRRLTEWQWTKSVEELLLYWFSHESEIDGKVLEEIRKLRDGGIKCYLHSNNEKYRIRYLSDELDLRTQTDGIFSSADLGCIKPQQEFWQAVHDKLGQVEKEDVLVWDDDLENVESARAFGFEAELYESFEDFTVKMQSYLNRKEYNEKLENELDKIEDELIREEQEKRKEEMPVSGRSVFEIKRIKEEKDKK